VILSLWRHHYVCVCWNKSYQILHGRYSGTTCCYFNALRIRNRILHSIDFSYMVALLVEALHYKLEGQGLIPGAVIEFSFTLSFWPHYVPGVTSASNKNEHQGYLLGGNSSWCTGLTALPCSCSECLEILGLGLLEPLGRIQAYKGTALPFPYRSIIRLIQGCRTVWVHPFQLWTTWLIFIRFGVVVMTVDVTQNPTLLMFLQSTCQKCKLLRRECDYGHLLNFVSFRRVIFL
jgi:hypothetical protein